MTEDLCLEEIDPNDGRFIHVLADEAQFKKDLEAWWDENLSRIVKTVTPNTKKFSFTESKLGNILFIHMKSGVMKGYKKGVSDVSKLALAEDEVPKEILDVLKVYSLKLAKKEVSFTIDKMKGILSDAIAKGWGIPETRDVIVEEMSSFSKYKAEVIARTEIQKVVNEGRLLGYKNEGVEKVEFLTANNACPTCSALNGKVYDRGDASGTIPVHCNCKCVWIPVVE
jgi:SPP1 gp7 family putative phage head morphogenesis protein